MASSNWMRAAWMLPLASNAFPRLYRSTGFSGIRLTTVWRSLMADWSCSRVPVSSDREARIAIASDPLDLP